MRVKNAYTTYPVIQAAQGVKIAAKDLESAVSLFLCDLNSLLLSDIFYS
jgi:hypothetical protein